MTSLSVDREREHAKPRECVARAICNATMPKPSYNSDAWDNLATWVAAETETYAVGVTAERDAFLATADAVLKALISHGWITDLGLEAMKKERGME